jgi:hypothetical protein
VPSKDRIHFTLKFSNMKPVVLQLLIALSFTIVQAQTSADWNLPYSKETVYGNGMYSKFQSREISMLDLRNEVAKTSDLIFEGIIIKQDVHYADFYQPGDSLVSFLHELIKVTKVYKGDIKGDYIEMISSQQLPGAGEHDRPFRIGNEVSNEFIFFTRETVSGEVVSLFKEAAKTTKLTLDCNGGSYISTKYFAYFINGLQFLNVSSPEYSRNSDFSFKGKEDFYSWLEKAVGKKLPKKKSKKWWKLWSNSTNTENSADIFTFTIDSSTDTIIAGNGSKVKINCFKNGSPYAFDWTGTKFYFLRADSYVPLANQNLASFSIQNVQIPNSFVTPSGTSSIEMALNFTTGLVGASVSSVFRPASGKIRVQPSGIIIPESLTTNLLDIQSSLNQFITSSNSIRNFYHTNHDCKAGLEFVLHTSLTSSYPQAQSLLTSAVNYWQNNLNAAGANITLTTSSLIDNSPLATLQSSFAPIKGKIVVYRGATQSSTAHAETDLASIGNIGSLTPSGNAQIFSEGKMVMNSAYGLNTYVWDTTGIIAADKIEMYNIFIHEIGHALGLSHTINATNYTDTMVFNSDNNKDLMYVTGKGFRKRLATGRAFSLPAAKVGVLRSKTATWTAVSAIYYGRLGTSFPTSVNFSIQPKVTGCNEPNLILSGAATITPPSFTPKFNWQHFANTPPPAKFIDIPLNVTNKHTGINTNSISIFAGANSSVLPDTFRLLAGADGCWALSNKAQAYFKNDMKLEIATTDFCINKDLKFTPNPLLASNTPTNYMSVSPNPSGTTLTFVNSASSHFRFNTTTMGIYEFSHVIDQCTVKDTVNVNCQNFVEGMSDDRSLACSNFITVDEYNPYICAANTSPVNSTISISSVISPCPISYYYVANLSSRI